MYYLIENVIRICERFQNFTNCCKIYAYTHKKIYSIFCRKINQIEQCLLISRRYCVQINNMLKYVAFVVAITFKYTQNLLRVKITTLLKFIKIYNKRKIVFVNNINVLFANIARNF